MKHKTNIKSFITTKNLSIVRTPEIYFQNLTDFPYEPLYLENFNYTDGARLSYIDEGSHNSEVALFLHGNLLWSYCYRKMIPIMLNAGFRVIAIDMIGFGRSDKPIDQNWHDWYRHYNILKEFIIHLNLEKITLICHDWGGEFGLKIVPSMPERFEKIIALNTMLTNGYNVPKRWYSVLQYSNENPELDPAAMFRDVDINLTEEEMQGFMAPYLNSSTLAAIRQFPRMVADHPNKLGASLGESSLKFWQEDWQGQSFVAIGTQDKVLSLPTKNLANTIRNCPKPLLLDDIGHFVHERGDLIAHEALKSFSQKFYSTALT